MRILRLCALAVIAAVMAACTATQSAGPPATPPGARAYLVFFEPDSAAITQVARDTLGQAVAHLNAAPDARIVVEGHTDLVGSPDYNLALGVRRAAAVQAFLTDAGRPGECAAARGRIARLGALASGRAARRIGCAE